MKINIILISTLVLLLQGCSSTPEKHYYFPDNKFKYGTISIPYENKGDELDDEVLELLDSQAKQGHWELLAKYSFETLNPQDLTYYYLGLSAEKQHLHKSALYYYRSALDFNKLEETCTGVLYDNCNDLDFPSEIYKAIDRVNIKIKQVQYSNRPRSVTINIDQPGSFFSINGNRYKSGESVNLTPGQHKVKYYSDTLFSEGAVTLTSKGPSAESVTLNLKNNPKDSLTINDINEAIKITNQTIKALKGKAEINTGMDKLSELLDWKKDVNKQYKSIQSNLLKLDRETSLYKRTSKYTSLIKDLNKLITVKVTNTETENFSEYLILASSLNNLGIKANQVPIYNNARLKGSELYSAVVIDSLRCKSYVLATKNPLLEVHLKDSSKSKHTSQYIQEYREIPNDRYSQIKSELREARYALEDYRYEKSVSDSGYGGSGWLALSSGFLGGMRGDQLKEDISALQSKLRNTPRTIREEIKGDYHPVKNNVTFVKDNSVEWMSINCNSGRVNTYKLVKEEFKDFTLYEGVRSDDLNRLSSTNQSTKNLMKQWSGKSFISLEDIENENNNYLLSTSIIDIHNKSVRSKVKEFLYK